MGQRFRIAIISCFFAGCGGLLPTLSNMAGKMITQDDPIPPHLWTLLPLGIFFFIGVILNCAFNRTDWEIGRALAIGISAPGIITNLVSGANVNSNQNTTTTKPAVIQPGTKINLLWPLIETAHAQESAVVVSQIPTPQPSVDSVASTPLLVNVSLGGPYAEKITGLPVTTVIIANKIDQQSQEIFRTDVAPIKTLIQIPKGTKSITFTVLSKTGNTFSSGGSIPLPSSYYFASQPSNPSSVQITLHATTSGDVDLWWAFGSDRPPVITAVEATIDGVPYLSAPRLPICRTAANGVERFQRVYPVDKESGWRGGGYNQTAWCQDVINTEKATLNSPSEFKILGSSEVSRKSFFGHVEYNYTCHVQVSTDPVYVEAPNNSCEGK